MGYMAATHRIWSFAIYTRRMLEGHGGDAGVTVSVLLTPKNRSWNLNYPSQKDMSDEEAPIANHVRVSPVAVNGCFFFS